VRRSPLLAAVFIPLVAAAEPLAKQASPPGAPTREVPPPDAPVVTTARSLPATGSAVAESVVLVQVYRSRYDWSLPWRQEAVESSLGSGFLITGGRIVTNAHVVADARQVLVRRPDQANPFVAEVARVAHDCDLALLTVEDPAFAKGIKALDFGELPRSGSRVSTYGFPLGGQEVSSTAGIVSRVESRGYVHTGVDSHLVVQTDAAINPGNSGGPVVQDGRVVGVAFQGYPGFDNMGFFIPVPVVNHFLDDSEDGSYDGFPDSGLTTQPLLSPSYRRERGLPAGKSGVVVELVAPGSTLDGVVQKGDVLLSVDGFAVANDGTIKAGDTRVTFEHAVDMKQQGETLRLTVFRDGKELSLSAVSRRLVRLDRLRNRYGVAPRYVVYAGLVFMPLERELMKVLGRGGSGAADRNIIWHHLYREAEQPETAEREVVVMTRVLRHSVNSQMTFGGPVAVARINGVALRGLADVPEALQAGQGAFHTIEYEGASGLEALDRARAEEAHPEILNQYGITRDRNL
jgi:S1-C subfamily serine protease